MTRFVAAIASQPSSEDGLSREDPIEVPAIGHAPEIVLAAVLEHDARARREVLNGRRNDDLGRRGERCDPGSDTDCEAADFAVDRLDLTGMDARPDLDPERFHGGHDRLGAADRASWAVERGEQAVARGPGASRSRLDRGSLRRITPGGQGAERAASI